MKKISGFILSAVMIAFVAWLYAGDIIAEKTGLPISKQSISDAVFKFHDTKAEASNIADPSQRHPDLKQYMLQLTNKERLQARAPLVQLGTNPAAQLHAEAALEGCYNSHWDQWGLKPNHRYTLTGGTGAGGENWHGSLHCIKAEDNYASHEDMIQEMREAIAEWMESPGHRKQLLNPVHQLLNLGIAYDRYNIVAIQHFSSDYISYQTKPHIDEYGSLQLEATASGASLEIGTVNVHLSYDPPPERLNRGQLSHTYSLCNPRIIGYIVGPPAPRSSWTDPEVTRGDQENQCIDPYRTPASWPEPKSIDEAHVAWATAKEMSAEAPLTATEVIRITAEVLEVTGSQIILEADLSRFLEHHGPGIYSVSLWGKPDHMGTNEQLSQQAILWQTEYPSGNPYVDYRQDPPMAVPDDKKRAQEPTAEPTAEPTPNPAAAATQPAKEVEHPNRVPQETLPTTTPVPVPTIEMPGIHETEPAALLLTVAPIPKIIPNTPTIPTRIPLPTQTPTPTRTPTPTSIPTPTRVPRATSTPVATPTRAPAPTPKQPQGPLYETYTDPIVGYSVQHPYGWQVLKGKDTTAFLGDIPVRGVMVVETYEVLKSQSVGDLADAYIARMMLAQAPGWVEFSPRWDGGGNNSSGPFLIMRFSRRIKESDCEEDGEVHIFRSKYAPKKLVGYAVTMSVCAANQGQLPQSKAAYLKSFTEN